MQAWTFQARGLLSEVLKLHHDIPQPQPSDLAQDEVLVKISHSALFQPESSFVKVLPHFNDKHWIPGFEFSGIVIASGHESGSLDTSLEGEAVFGMIGPKLYRKYNGVLAEYVIAPKTAVVRKPKHMSFEEASGISGGGATAIGLLEKARLLRIDVDNTTHEPIFRSMVEGGKVLITGGSTGTGLIILQMVKMLVGEKGKVVTTASPRNTATAKSYGADEVIDYTQHPDLHKYLTTNHSSTPFDAIIDITGSDPLLYQYSPTYLKREGVFVFAGNMSRTHASPDLSVFGALMWIYGLVSLVLSWYVHSIWPAFSGGVPRRSFFFSGQPNARNLDLVQRLVEDRKLKGSVDSVWDMEDVLKVSSTLTEKPLDAAWLGPDTNAYVLYFVVPYADSSCCQAFDYLGKGKICGKVVIKVGQ